MKSSWPPLFPASPTAAQPLPASLLCPCLPLCSAQGSSALAWFLQKPSTAPQLPWRALAEGRARASALTGQRFPAGLHRAVPLKKHNHPINIQSLHYFMFIAYYCLFHAYHASPSFTAPKKGNFNPEKHLTTLMLHYALDRRKYQVVHK